MIFFLALALLLPTHLLSMAGANVLNKQEAQWFLNYYCQSIQYQASHSPRNLGLSGSQMSYLGKRYTECASAVSNGQQGAQEVVNTFCFTTEPKAVRVAPCVGNGCNAFNLLGVNGTVISPCDKLCALTYLQKFVRQKRVFAAGMKGLFSRAALRKGLACFGDGFLIGTTCAVIAIPIVIGVAVIFGKCEISIEPR